MNILHVTPCFYPAWAYGGIPRVAYELSRELVKRGHTVTVFTTDVLDESFRYSKTEDIVEGIKIHYFKNLSNHLAYAQQLYLPLGFSNYLGRVIKDFDIVHLHGYRHLLNNVARCWAMKFRKPYVFSAHGTILRIERKIIAKRFFDIVFGNKVIFDAAQFVAVSNNEARQYEMMGISKERVSIIYNGIDTEVFRRLPPKGSFRKKYDLLDKKIVLFLGKITPRKGVDFLVKAFAEFKKGKAVLVIAGNVMELNKGLDKIIKEKFIKDDVIFTGFLSGHEKLAAYVDADVVVYPAIYEIFGLVPFEAIMCGTPVIVADDCGCGEIIGGEDIGYTVRYNDVDGLRSKIDEVLVNRSEALEKVERGKRFITQNLNWPKIVTAYEDMYRKLI